MLIGLKGAERFIRIAWNVCNVEGEHPIGCILVAPPGLGKSYLLTSFKGDNWVIAHDVTGHGLEKLLIKIKRMKAGYLVLPDLIRAFTRRTSLSLISVLNVILEEGITRIERYDMSVNFEEPLKFGFIGAITVKEFDRRYKDMQSTGLISRCSLFRFHYAKEDVFRIEEYIARNGMPKEHEKIPLEIVERKPVSVDKPVVAEFVKKTGRLLAKLKNEAVPFRSIKLIRRLVKGNAIMSGRTTANLDDCVVVFSLLPFFIDSGCDVDYRLLRYIAKTTIKENWMPTEEDLLKKAKMYAKDTIRQRIQYLLAKGLIVFDTSGFRLPDMFYQEDSNEENNKLYLSGEDQG